MEKTMSRADRFKVLSIKMKVHRIYDNFILLTGTQRTLLFECVEKSEKFYDKAEKDESFNDEELKEYEKLSNDLNTLLEVRLPDSVMAKL